jgi:hypothetical protein
MVPKNDRSRNPLPATTTITVTHTLTTRRGVKQKTTEMVLPGAFRLIFEGMTAHE